MSTKIYNGYKTKAMSGAELLEFVNMLREKIRPIGRKLYIDEFAYMISRAVEGLAVQGEWPFRQKPYGDDQSLYFAVDAAMRKQRDEDRTREKSYRFDCNFVLLPQQDQTLILIYYGEPGFLKAFEAIPGIEPYWYWDNTDPDESVSEADWSRREQDWEQALGDDAPSIRGLTVECFIDWLDFSPVLAGEQVIAAIPVFDSRVKIAALNMAFSARAKELGVEDKIISHWGQIDRWLKTEDGRTAREKAAEEIAPLLPLITTQLLTTPIKDIRRKDHV